ncbi:MAG: outer membrane protein W [Parvibaculaceae bacterium]|jgi:hypothetical protein
MTTNAIQCQFSQLRHGVAICFTILAALLTNMLFDYHRAAEDQGSFIVVMGLLTLVLERRSSDISKPSGSVYS